MKRGTNGATHYVKYRYRGPAEHANMSGVLAMNGKWRVYRDGKWIDPVYGVYHYETKASAEKAVKDMLAREHDTMVAPPFVQPKQTTRCLNCGRILTDENGDRLESANFDSSLPSFPIYGGGLYQNVVWARCDSCHFMAISKRAEDAPPQMDEDERLGAPVTLPNGKMGRMCPAKHATECYLCCKPTGHTGRHVAEFNGSRQVFSW